MKIEYYKIVESKQHYKGEKYFKFDPMSEHATQVCKGQGTQKKGKSRTIGIYTISRITFLSNYSGHYIEPCTQTEYEQQFEEVIKMLR